MYFAKTKTQIALTSIKSTKGREKRVRFTAVPQEQSWSHPSQSSQLVMVPALLNNRTFRIISQTARSQRKTLVLQNIETYSSTVNAKTAVSTQNQGSHRRHRIRDSWSGRTLLTSPHRNVPFFQNRFTEWFQVSGPSMSRYGSRNFGAKMFKMHKSFTPRFSKGNRTVCRAKLTLLQQLATAT